MAQLQNEQLATELEYQSKESEKLIKKNKKLEESIATLKKDLSLHQQLENELAKKSKYFQLLIKELQDKIRDMEAASTIKKAVPISEKPTNDSLVQFLEEKLENAEKLIQSGHSQFERIRADNSKLKGIIETSKNKYNKAALLLAEFLESILEGSPNLLLEQKDIMLDIDRLRKNKLEDISKEERAAFILILLKQLQPYISDINMALESNVKESENMYAFLNKVNVLKDNPSSNEANIEYENNKLNRSFLPSLKTPHKMNKKRRTNLESKFYS